MESIEALKKKLAECQKDGKEKFKILNQLSQACLNKSPDKSLEYGKQALELSEKVNNVKEKVKALNIIGTAYYYLSDCPKVIEYCSKALKIGKELKDKKEIVCSLNNIGNAYDDLGNNEKALEFHINSLEIGEEIEDKKGISTSLSNIGVVYFKLRNCDKSLEYFLKSIKIREDIKDKKGMAISLTNIGNVYGYLKKHDKALEYFKKSLKIKKEIKDKKGIGSTLNNIGLVYSNLNNNKKALEYHQEALKIREEIEDKRGVAISFTNIGVHYSKLRSYDKALSNLKKGLKLAKEIKAKDMIQYLYEQFSDLYSAKNNYKKALEYYKLYSEKKDSIFTEESSKKIAEMQTKYETEKKEKEAEIFRLKNVELVKANNKLKEANKIIAEKNEHIMSSIRYAERIQNAILPLNEKIKKALPEHFIIFKPRDIVSGDFYWFNQIKDKIIFAVVDCTGHGVPGAFMSMIGNTILNELINEKHILDPALILENLHTEVRFALKQETGEAESTDGMDVCLCVMEPKKHKLTFSGAKRPLYHVTNSTLTKIKGDKKTIGGRQKEEKRTFTNHDIDIREGDAVYLTSDGFADQSDVKGQKYGSKRMEKLFLNTATQSCQKQKHKLLTELINHSGKEEQRDDITVIGIGI